MPAMSLLGHTEGTTLEFVFRLCGPPRGRLCLAYPFAKAMEVDKLQGVWLHVHGCHHNTVYTDVEYPTPHIMLLRCRWKTFARAHNFMVGHVLRSKLVEVDMLSVKIYGHSGSRLGCCEESSSDTERSSSSYSDEEDNADGVGDNDSDNESPAVNSEHDGSGSS
ncbi:l-ascorbate oxidase-like protein [Hordeum vulgare]|nr:l-ascorbate oxidase-like protein [Hordeum vulgare]